jgi:hypothetical protein
MLKGYIGMKRDMDLIRTMLLTIEANEHGFVNNIEIEGYTQEEIGYHAYLLGQAGLANVSNVPVRSESPRAIIRNLTWEGHEFLDATRENSIWNQAKDKINKIGGATLPIWTALLTELLKQKLGL